MCFDASQHSRIFPNPRLEKSLLSYFWTFHAGSFWYFFSCYICSNPLFLIYFWKLFANKKLRTRSARNTPSIMSLRFHALQSVFAYRIMPLCVRTDTNTDAYGACGVSKSYSNGTLKIGFVVPVRVVRSLCSLCIYIQAKKCNTRQENGTMSAAHAKIPVNTVSHVMLAVRKGPNGRQELNKMKHVLVAFASAGRATTQLYDSQCHTFTLAHIKQHICALNMAKWLRVGDEQLQTHHIDDPTLALALSNNQLS